MTIDPALKPLSAAQRSIVDAQLLDPDSDVFVVADRIDIVGDVSTALLAEAIAATVRETAALGCRVVVDESGEPGLAAADVDVTVAVHDVSDEADPAAAAEELVAAELARGAGGLGAAEPVGQLIVRTAADRVVWLQRYHHAALDGYGMSLVAQRVAERYRVLAGAGPLGAGFGVLDDLVVEERAHTTSETGAAERTRVRELVAAVPTAIESDGTVPTVSGRAAPAVRRAIGIDVGVDERTAARIADLLEQERRLTWADLHVAAYAAFTARAAGTPALVLGVPFSTRTTSAAARTPSMSVTVLPLALLVDPRESLVQLAGRVATGLSVLRRSQRVRGEAVAGELGIPSLLRGPGVNLKPYTPVLDFVGARGLLRTETAGPVDDLDLSIAPGEDGGVQLRLEANPDTYRPAELAAVAARYAGFLAASMDDPRRPLGQIAALPVGAPGPSSTEPLPAGGIAPVDVMDVLDRTVHAHPHDIAVRAGAESITFTELHRRVRALAAVLTAHGAAPERVVAIALPRGIDLVVAIFAVLESGAALTPIDLAYPDERIAYLLDDAEPVVVVAAPGTAAARHPGAIVVDHGDIAALPNSTADPLPVPHPAALAYVVYTSGSTGRPKGVGVSREALAFFIAHHAATLFGSTAALAGRRLRAAHTASFAFDSSWEQLLWLVLGHELIVFDEDDRRDAREIVEAVDRLGIDTFDVTPSFANALVEEGLLETAHTPALLLIGGEAAPAELWRRLAGSGVPAHNFYGPTEATVDAIGTPVRGVEPRIGRALAGTDALVLDIALQPVPAGVVGELYLAGPHLARGYRGRHGLTAARFVADPRGGGGRLYRTGDLVRIEADGALSMLGRTDDQVKIRGHRVEPGEVRAALAALAGVADAAAIVRGDGSTARLLAYAVPREGALDAAALHAALRAGLPDHLVPSAVVILDALPLTTHGKLDAVALPEPERAAVSGAAPTTVRERAVCTAIGAVLGLDEVPADADVIVLGGDSISAITIVARLRAAGWLARPRDLFAARTAQALAPLLTPLESAPARQRVSASGPVPLPPVARALRRLAPSLDAVSGYAQSVAIEVEDADAVRVGAALAALSERHPVISLVVEERADGSWVAGIPSGRKGIAFSTTSEEIEEARAAAVAGLDPSAGQMAVATLCVRAGVLVFAAHHLVVDAVSWRILVDELETLLGGSALPAGPESGWRARALALDALVPTEEEAAHWRGLHDVSCAVFPERGEPGRFDEAVRVVSRAGADTARAVLDTLPLLLDARPDTVLAGALADALQQWRAVEGQLLLEWETHGRDPIETGEDTSDSIGWFTTEFPVRIALPRRSDPDEERLAEAVRAARQARAEVPRDGYGAETGGAQPSVLLNYLGRFDADTTAARPVRLHGDRPFAVHIPDALRLGYAIEVAVFVAPGDAGLEVEWTVEPALAAGLPVLRAAWDRALDALTRLAARPVAEAPPTLIPAETAFSGIPFPVLRAIEAERGPLRDVAPLSPLQEGLLFHALRDGADDVYTTLTTVQVEVVPDADGSRASIDPDRLADAVRTVVAAHPQLGAAFVADVVERPVQLVPRDPLTHVTVHDLSSSAADARTAELQALAEAELGRAVDVSRPPLVRAHVVRTGRSTAVLMLAAHHLVIDGWSTPLLVARILAAAAGEAVADGWPDLRRALADQVARDPAPAREAWAAHLAGIDEPTLLAAPAAGPVTPRILDVPLDPAAGERLLAAIRERGLTVGTVVTGAWAHVAARVRGAADVVVGTTTAGRGSAVEGLDRVIGLLSATVPVRVRLHPAEPFSLQLARLQQERAELQEHEGLPLADIESLAGVGTLFDSLVVVENYPDAVAASPGGLRVSDVQAAGATHYALGITVLPGAGLRIAIEHDLSRVSETRADALAAEFAAVLARLADDLDVTPLALPAPSDGTVLVGAQPASTPDDGSGACAVLRSFRAAVHAAPDAVALRTKDGALTAVELDAMAGGIQAALEARGVTADTIIAIALPRSAHVVAAIIGTLASGAAYLPLDLSAPDERTLLVLDDARPAVVVAARASAVGRLAEARGIPVVDPAEVAPTGLVPRAVPGDAAAYVIFTSGSTGRPKGVVLTRDALDTHFDGLRTGHQAELVARLQRTEGRARVVAVHSASFSFDTSLVQLHWLFAGHELLLLDDDERRDPDLFVARARYADVIDVAPVLAEQLVAAGLVDGERPLPEVFLGGEAVSDALWTALRERAATTRTHNLYGPTESTVDALGAVVTDSIDPLIGTPVAGVTATVLDGWLRPVPRTTAGELYLEGGQLARGYLGRAGLTATRFVAAPGGLRRYRTGDLVRVDDLDRVVYLGRLDDQVKVAGHRIELGEVEQAVREVDGVTAAAATIDQAGSVGARLIAAVVPAAGWELDGVGVRAHLAERLPVALVPSQVVVVDALPVGVSGKVDRAAVRAIAAQTVESDDREVQPPRTPEEEALVRAVSVVLDRPTVSVDDDFFALGGHSLTALRILGALRAVGYGLSIRDILDGRRLDRIAVRLRTLAASPAAQTRVGQRFGAVPVSTAQRRLLFLAELEGASAAYTVPVALDLHGRIPVEGLASAWAEVVERHPVLRTVYRRTDGGFAAEALADPPDAFAVVTLDPAASTADFEAAVAIEEGRTFDVFAAPPVRATLVLAGERAAFVVAAHHIAVDEASFTVIFEELSALIAGRSLPDAVPFSVLVAAAEEARDPLHDSALAERWLARLRGIPAELELPSDRPRPERSSFHAVRARAEVPSHLADSLAAFAAAQGVTSLMVLQTAVASLLHALGAGDDIVLGTPLSRRDDRGAERTVGYLVDTLPIRLDVSGDADLPGLVARTKAAVLDALDDAELPFEAIVEAVSPPRSLSRHPLFQTMVSIEGAVAPALVLPGVTVSERAGLVDAARLDLAIRYRAAEGEAASLTLVAAADLFDAESAERLLARLVAWIERLLDEPHRPVRVIDARLHDERERLLAPSSAVAAPRLLDGIADRVHADPDAQAVVGADRTLDYAGLAARVVGLAAELRAQGVGVEDRVAVAVGRSSSLVVSLLAVLAVGAAYVPVDADYPEARVRLMLDDAAPALVLVDGSTRGAGRGRPELVVDDAPVADRDPLALADALHAAAHIPDTAAAYVIYTSGSTGRPKGVVVSRAALDAFLAHETGVLALTPEDRLLAVTTISFDIAALELYVPLLSGAAVVLADRGDVRDPDRLVALAVRTGCTMLQATPSLWRPLLDAHPDAWSGVTALVGGEALPGALAGALREACRSVRNVYGPTEATVWATACVVDDVAVADTGAGSAVAIGAPFAGIGALVLDDSLRPVPDGVAGELYLSGLQLARGYHARPDLTVARFVADPHGAPGCRMYRTGDLVRRDAGGALRFLRRADDQVKVNGHRIELGEVEAALRSVDGVAHAAAVVRPDSEGRGRLQGYVVPAAGATLDPLQVRDELAASVPGPLVPQTVTVLEAIPLTVNGKVDRAALPEPAVVAPTGREPRTDAERAIVEAVAATLGLHRVSPDDAFFELGGDSISSIRLVALVRARGFVITPGLVFAHERLAGLAGAAAVLADASVDDAATEGAHPARRTRARIGARDLSSIERLLENSP